MNRSRAALGSALWLTTFSGYALLCPRGLTGGDAGELIAASHTLATAHPPGYPLYVWSGWAFALLAPGSLAQRYNLFSALAGAFAVTFFFFALSRWTRALALPAACAVALATSGLMLTWCTRAEVFALDQALAAALLWLAVELTERPSRGLALGLGVTFGAGLGNHQTLLLFGAPVVLAALVRAAKPQRLAAVAGVGLGLLVYALVPLGAVLGPEHSWGDVLTPSGFVAHLLRADYGTFQLAADVTGAPTPLAAQLAAFGVGMLEAAGWVGVPLAAFGAWQALKTPSPQRLLAGGLLAAWVLSGPGFVAVARFPLTNALMGAVLQRFWLLPLVPLTALAALGLHAACAGRPRLARSLAAVLCAASLARAAASSPPKRTESLPERYAQALLAPLVPNAVLLVRGDLPSNAVRYAQLTGMRPDVTVLDQELLTYAWYVARHTRPGGVVFPAAKWLPGAAQAFDLAGLLSANPGRHFYVAGSLKPHDPSAALLQRWPAGLAERLLSGAVPEAQVLQRARLADELLLASPFAAAAAEEQRDAFDDALLSELWEAQHRLAVSEISSTDAATVAEGEARLWRLISRHPAPPAQYYRNAAIADAKLQRPEPLRRALERYLQLAGPHESDRAAFEAELGRMNAGDALHPTP